MNKEKFNKDKKRKLESIIDISIDKLCNMIDVNCVIGNAISMPNNSVVIPISKVSVGFVAGGGEYNDLNSKRTDSDYPMAAGTGGGFTISPVGFFVVNSEKFKLIRADKSTAYLGLIKNATDVLKSMMEKIK